MKREWLMPAKILTGICALAASSFSQTYTISAKPGAVNFIEGDVSINGDPVFTANLKSTFLNANDVIAVGNGKAEVLLTPGVFLRLGQDSKVRMVRPSLIETQVEVISGESMIEVDDITPGTSLAVLDHGSSTTLVKAGLYKFTETSIATLDGKADVAYGDRKLELKKNKEVALTDDSLKPSKLDLDKGDDLYAWSNNRAQYAAAVTYAGAKDVYNNSTAGYSSSFNSPGWYWNSPFNSFMWMPGNGAFYSPFGWGFYGPGVVAYAPVFAYPYGGAYVGAGYAPVRTGVQVASKPTGSGTLYVPVNPGHVGVAGLQSNSPAAFSSARDMMQRSVMYTGLRTANGAPAANLQSGRTFQNMQSATHAAAASARTSAPAAVAGGGGFRGGAGNAGGGMTSSAPRAVGGGGHSSK